MVGNDFSIRNYCLLFFLLFFTDSNAQTGSISEDADSVEMEKRMNLDWCEKMAEMEFFSEDEENSYEEMENSEEVFRELEERKEHPLNLNTATREQLEGFPFLSDFQIEHLLQYREVHGSMETVYELQLVEGMDQETIRYLLPYVCVQPVKKRRQLPSFKTICQYGRNEAIARFDIPLYTREGYRSKEADALANNPNKQYLGPSWYHSLRYSFRYSERFYAGFTAEKDAGEPFFGKHNRKGYDSYSLYFLLRDIGKIRSLAVGKYRVTFGQGLVVGNEYSFGKGASVAGVRNRNTGFKKHSSTDESTYFRGIGATYAWNEKICFSLFYSHRSLDGIADKETLTSVSTTGKHALPREVERKNAATLQTVGGNINYLWTTNLKIGMTGVCYFFDKYYDPQYRPYNLYYFRGKRGYNVGIDYKYRFRRFLCNGEVATDREGNAAMIHSVHYYVSSTCQFTTLYRNYDKKYRAFHAHSLAEGGRIQNENGMYVGVETRPLKNCRWLAYLDFFRFPYLKYLVDEPSSGFDGWMQFVYTPFSSWNLDASYRFKRKGKNYKDPDTQGKCVAPYVTQCLKLQGNYLLHPNWLWKAAFQWRAAGSERASLNQGLSMAQTVTYKRADSRFQISGTYVLFDTDDYSSRVYVYEKSLLYSFYVPSYYGKGNRISLSFRYEFSTHLLVVFKYGQTVYADRGQIGSGLEAIEGNRKADLNVQIRWKF